jgi:surface antigen
MNLSLFARNLVIALALSFFAGVTLIPSANAQGIFNKDSVTMDPGDWDKLKASVRSVLDDYKPGATQSWKSSTTDQAGQALLVETFTKNGLKCAQVIHRFTAGQGGRTYDAPLCQVADGTWKLAF